MPRPNRGHFLERNANGIWYICWFERGRKKGRSTGEKNLGLAEQVKANFVLGQKEAEISAAPVSLALARYLELHANVNVESKDTAQLAVEHLTASRVGDVLIKDLRQRHIEEYVADRKRGAVWWTDPETGKRRGGRIAGPSSCRREVTVLVAALNSRVNEDLLAGIRIPKFKMPPAGDARDRWLTEDELTYLLAWAENVRRDDCARLKKPDRLSRAERFLWATAHTAGRRAAVLGLQWDKQVDFETNVIHLNPPGRRQTKKRRSSVPMGGAFRDFMARAYDERTGPWVLDSDGAVKRSVGRVLAASGLEDVTPSYTLRHTAATHMARRGVPLWKVAKILGNSVQQTEKTYAHHCPDDLREAVTMIGRPAKLSTA